MAGHGDQVVQVAIKRSLKLECIPKSALAEIPAGGLEQT